MPCQGWVRGMPRVDQLCDGCLGKHRRTPFLVKAEHRSEQKLELVHGDLFGSIKPTTPGEKNMFLLIVNDFSRYMWLVLL
jgi:hypothetical protein